MNTAAQMAKSLGISVVLAQQLNDIGYATRTGAGRGGDPRDFGGSADDIQTNSPAAQLAQLKNWKLPSIGGAGGASGGGGASKIEAQTNAINDQIAALEESANPLLKYNKGMAALDKLKLAGLSDGAYAKGVADLAEELRDAEGATDDFTKTFQDGFEKALNYTLDGFKDGFSGLLDIVKNTIMDAIKFAIMNPIKLALGMTSTGSLAPVAANAATGGSGGGGASGLLGGLGGIGAAFGAGAAGMVTSLVGAGGGLAAAGTYMSAVAGTALTSVSAFAAAAGAIAVPLLAVAAVVSFFKKKTKLIDSGIRATLDMEEAMFESFKTIKTTRFWGLSKKIRTSYTNLSPEEAAPLTAATDTVKNSVIQAAESLGVASSVFDGFSHSFKLSLKGLDEAEQQEKIEEAMMGLGDALAMRVLGITDAISDGSYDELLRLSNSLIGVNDAFRDLGFGLYEISLAGGEAAATFAELFGSLENFGTATAFYYDQFYTDREKLDNATSRLTEILSGLGVDAVPSTNAGYRALVDAANQSGDEELTAALIQIAPAFDSVTDAANLLSETLLAGVDENRFATGIDYMRGRSRISNGLEYDPEKSSSELLAELRALNARVDMLQSTSEITAANTGNTANNTDDQLAITMETAL
jgi:hypothetical protein